MYTTKNKKTQSENKGRKKRKNSGRVLNATGVVYGFGSVRMTANDGARD